MTYEWAVPMIAVAVVAIAGLAAAIGLRWLRRRPDRRLAASVAAALSAGWFAGDVGEPELVEMSLAHEGAESKEPAAAGVA